MELTSFQDKCCHMALAAIKIRRHLQQVVELVTAYCCHVILVLFSLPDCNKKNTLHLLWTSVSVLL